MVKLVNQSSLERDTLEGDSPVDKTNTSVFKRVRPPGLEV